MLALVGCVSVPEAVWAKLERGERLTLDEEAMIHKHPRVGYELLAGIPRLGEVAEAIRYQDRRYDGWDDTGLTYSGNAIPIGARLLKLASDYDAAVQRGLGPGSAFLELEAHKHYYDPAVLAALKQVVGRSGPGLLMKVPLAELRPGMTLKDGLFNRHGVRMMAAQEVTPARVGPDPKYDPPGTDPGLGPAGPGRGDRGCLRRGRGTGRGGVGGVKRTGPPPATRGGPGEALRSGGRTRTIPGSPNGGPVPVPVRRNPRPRRQPRS